MTGPPLPCHAEKAWHRLITLLPLFTGWEPPRTDNVDGLERLSTGSAREVTDDAQSFALMADVEDTGVNQLSLTEQSNRGAGALTTKKTAALLTTSAGSSR